MRRTAVAIWSSLVWLCPFVSDAIAPDAHSAIQLSLMTLGLLLCWRLPAPRIPSPAGLSRALGTVIALGLLALALSPRRDGAVLAWMDVIAPAIVVPVLWRLEPDEVRRLLLGLLVGGVVISSFALLQYAVILPELASLSATRIAAEIQEVAARRRVLGTFPLPNLLAGYLAMLLPLAAAVLMAAPQRLGQRLVAVSCLVLAGLAFLLTQSLGATCALLGAYALVMITRGGRRQRSRWLLWAVGSSVLVGSLLAVRPMLRDIAHQHNPIRNRLAYWKVTATIIREHPLRGVGFGEFRHAFDAFRPEGAQRVLHAHNSYLELWAELGIIGLLAWLWLIGETLRAANRVDRWLAVAACAFALHNLVDFSLYVAQVNVLWWVLVGLAARGKGA